MSRLLSTRHWLSIEHTTERSGSMELNTCKHYRFWQTRFVVTELLGWGDRASGLLLLHPHSQVSACAGCAKLLTCVYPAYVHQL